MPTNWDETIWNPFHRDPFFDTIQANQLLLPGLLCVLLWSFVNVRRGKGVGYVVCVFLFAVYVWVFLANTVFSFPYVLRLNEFPWQAFHWVPALIEGTDPEFRLDNSQVWGNFLAGVPFGFGFPFVASPQNSTLRRMVGFGLLWGIMPEFLQVIQMWLFAFVQGRTIDIDDVWLCFTGTLAGYGILWLLARFYVRLGFSRGARLPIWNHFHDVLIRIGTPSAADDNPVPVPAERSEVKT
jgi:glycopeptide antibiotics resistance protein